MPESFTAYIALSAAWTSSSEEAATSGSVAAPTDTVRWANIEAVAGQEHVGRDFLADALANRERALAARVGQHQCKLVAAEARHDVGLARAAANHGRRFDQRAAPDEMAVRVVDRLEAVQVDEQRQREVPCAHARFVSRRST